jgi:hypothetical protein
MKITVELLEKNREALIVERDGYLQDSERALGQATAVGGAIRLLEHLIDLARKPEEEK